MKRILLIIGIVILVLGVGGYFALQWQFKNTKKNSPEQTVTYSENGADISIFYCRPSKKGREIFGEGNLVPYGKWWRTGANEPTQLTTSKDLIIDGKTLPAGKYSIVTIPEANEWTVIFNSKIPFWGTQYYPDEDVLRVKANVDAPMEEVEMLTIAFDKTTIGQDAITFAWDRTKVAVPFEVKN